MNTMKEILLISVSILISATSYAQAPVQFQRGSTQLEDIMPPTPEAAMASRYSDVPFSHSDGAASYSVPVYTLQGRELSIPISLEYRSSGIKLDEVAGVAGLGWTLRAGGCISREVVFMPDEFSSGTFHYELPSNELLGWLEEGSHNTERLAWVQKVLWNRIDCNPDRYHYSICGLSGSFIIRPDGEIVQLDGDGVLISYDSSSQAFTVVGPDGTVYRLADRERGQRDGATFDLTPFSGQQPVWGNINTAWYVSSITSPSGAETATFSYTSGSDWNRDTHGVTKTLTCSNRTGTISRSVTTNYSTTTASYTTKRLSSISLDGFSASFSYASVTGHPTRSEPGSSGLPYNYPYRLTGITVSTGATQLLHMDVGTEVDSRDGRVILSSLRLYHGSTLDDRWSFSYYSNNSTVSRYSQDWFGYFNAENESGGSGLEPGHIDDWILPGNDDPIGGGPQYPAPAPEPANQSPGGRTSLCPYTFNSYYGLELSYGTPNADYSSYMSLACANHDGAVTTWTYEGATAPAAGMSAIPVGVRVRRIAVLNGTDTVRVRSFSYAYPHVSGVLMPTPRMYATNSISQHENSGGFGNLPRSYIVWKTSIHDSQVGPGETISSTHVHYASVTEDDSGPLSSGGNGKVRTVYTFSCPPQTGYETINHYPNTWRTIMRNAVGIEEEALFFAFVQDGYKASGPKEAVLPTSRTDYAWKSGVINFSPVREEQTQYNDIQNPAVFAGYHVTQVGQPVEYGNMSLNDVYHYPIWTYRSYGRVPTRITRIDYRLNGNDTTSFSMVHTNRDASLLKPWRIFGTIMTGNDRDLHVSYSYPDNVSIGRTAWMDTLSSHHRLSTPVRTEYSRYRRVVVTYPVGPPNLEFRDRSTLQVSRDYDSYGGLWLPSATVETIDGVERWREDVLARDSRGNATSVKQKGKPRTDIAWDTSKRYPVSITEGAGSATPLVTQYHWIPGIGPDVVTDPAGQKTYYYYDAAGRLTSVRDTDGKLVSDYTYSLLNDGDDLRHVRTRTYRDANGATSTSDYTYWNALGMHLQDIALNATGDGIGGLVSSFEGDFMLHDDVKSWLPYPASGSTGAYLSDAIGLSIAYHGSTKAYSFRGYELSALDRIRSEAEPGYAGSHESVTGEFVREGYPILKWDDESGAVVQLGTYPSSQLVMEVAQDADARQSIALRDRTGRLLATYHREDPEDTPETHYGALILGVRTDPVRYVYDGKDRLRIVAGPGIALTDTLNVWRYSYDAFGRLASRGYPGSAVREFYTYDSEDRIVRMVRGTDVTETDYDALGRATAVRRAGPDGVLHLVETHTYTGLYETARRLALIAPDGTPGECNVAGGYVDYSFTYDNKGRVISTQATWPDGETQVETTGYDFSSQPTAVTLTATRPGGATAQLSTLTQYDLRERPTRTITALSLNGTPAVQDTTFYSYDAIGRPAGTSSSSGGSSVSSTLSYTLQGRQDTKIYRIGETSLFSEVLKYDTSGVTGFDGSYSGKIAGKMETWHEWPEEIVVQTELGPATLMPAGRVTREAYKYDYTGKLEKTGGFSRSTIEIPFGQSVDGTIFSYDERGNLLSADNYRGMIAYKSGDYHYDGDKLDFIISGIPYLSGHRDTLAFFSYDDQARMVHDGLAGTHYSYNALGLLRKVERADTIVVNYSYLADGTKAVAEREDGSGLVYRGSLTYRKDSTGVLTLESAPSPTGRITPGGMRYHVTDHLGSVRAVIDGQSGTILESSNYGVYGGRGTAATNAWPTASAPAGETLRDHFTGKEDQAPDFHFGITDFGARPYSPSLSRWLTPDPLSEKYYDVSPYVYCAGDPVNLVDPDGKKLYFAVGTSDTFKRRFAEAIQYMNNKGTSYNIAKLEESELVFYIGEGKNSFNIDNHTISWDPNYISKNYESGIMLSPLTSLAHEAGHASGYLEAVLNGREKEYKESAKSGSYDNYSSAEERRVITTTEQYASKKHGELPDDKVTRTNHEGHQVLFSNVDVSTLSFEQIINFIANENYKK